MGGLDDYKPAITMVAMQCVYAGISLITRAALLQGMSPRVFVVYRQTIATFLLVPIACFSRRTSSSRCSLGLRSFTMIFMASLIGVTLNQNIYFEGMYLASSSIASAMGNLVPAVTFAMASMVGLEKVDMRSLRSMAKIFGTVICVSGAVAMAILKGPKLLNSSSSSSDHTMLPSKSLLAGAAGGDGDWLLGCFLLFASSCCWSFWLILQVPMSRSYPDHLSLSAWMCFMAAVQSAVVTIFLEPDTEAWIPRSYFQIGALIYTAIGSAVTFFAQAWCISQRGPLFSALFNPLCTIIVTILAAIFLQEEIYGGSLVGGLGVVIGLYVVLWGKAKDVHHQPPSEKQEDDDIVTKIVEILIDETTEDGCINNLEQPLLSNK